MSCMSVADWTIDDCEAWARDLKLSGEVAEAFRANEVDGVTLLHLSAAEIRDELQIRSLRQRKDLHSALEKLRCGCTVTDFALAVEVQRKEIDEFKTSEEGVQDRMFNPSARIAMLVLGGFMDEGASCVADFKVASRFDEEDSLAARDVEASRDLQACCDEARALEAWDSEVARRLAPRQGAVGAPPPPPPPPRVQSLFKLAMDVCISNRVDVCGAVREGRARVLRRCSDLEEEEEEGVEESKDDVLGKQAEERIYPRSYPDERAAAGRATTTEKAPPELPTPVSITPFQMGSLRSMIPTTTGGESSQKTPAEDFYDDEEKEQEGWSSIQVCEACYERRKGVHELPCGTKFCRGCLRTLFINATRDISLMPPRCCGVEIDPNFSSTLLRGSPGDRQLEQRFRTMYVETTAKAKMYCPIPTCAAFINLDLIDVAHSSGELACPRCAAALCVLCKAKAHPLERACPSGPQDDDGTDLLLSLAEAETWKRCPSCSQLIELATGCNHMTCHCRFEFCFKCEEPWFADRAAQRRQCTCDLFEHENLDHAANRAVQAQQAAQGRNFGAEERFRAYGAAREQLQRHEECAPHEWRRTQPSPEWNCRNCHFCCHQYSYQCDDCDYVACFTCRFHRLE